MKYFYIPLVSLCLSSSLYSQKVNKVVNIGNPSDQQLKEDLAKLNKNAAVIKYKSDENLRRDWTPYGYDKEKVLTLNENKYPAFQATYCDYNLIEGKIASFTQKSINWAYQNFKAVTKTTFVEVYSEKGSFIDGQTPGQVTIKYQTFINKKGHSIIKGIVMIGSWDMLVDFFVKYWPTNIHINPTKENIVSCSFWMDKITLSFENGQGKIVIVNRDITDVADYENKLSENINAQLKLSVKNNQSVSNPQISIAPR